MTTTAGYITDSLDALSDDERNAYSAMTTILKEYGLESLAPKLLSYVQNGYSADTIALELQNTTEWKTRFAANELRRKAGLPVLSPQEYIATERAYRQVLQSFGLPVGFYDQQSDFQKWLAMDVSPQEIQGRAEAVSNFLQKKDPQELAFFSKYYTAGDMVAWALDANRALPLIGKAFAAATIGGSAANQGLAIGLDMAERLAAGGITGEQAQQGFGNIALEVPTANKLASLYGESGFTIEDLAAETFMGDATTAERRTRLASKERASFAGASGATKGSLSTTTGGV